VLVGVHWAAPFIHAAVALVLAAAIVFATRKIQGKTITVERIVRAHIALWKQLRNVPRKLIPSAICQPALGLAERLGMDLWQRPPPVAV
jgi:hypothetical protein